MTTNNNEEPGAAAFEKQVQTLAVAVECLTKLNDDLDEQLCQRDIGPNIHEEEQEGTSIERKD